MAENCWFEHFVEKNFKKQIKKTEKVIRRKGDKSYVRWKSYDNSFNSWINEKNIVWVSEYFPKARPFGGNVNIILDFSRGVVGSSDFAKRTNLPNLKYDVDKLDIDKLKNVPGGLCNLKSKLNKLDIGKLETTPVDLSKRGNVVKNDVAKKTKQDELVINVNVIQTSNTSDLVKKPTITQKLMKSKRKLVVLIRINKLLLKNSIS